MRREESEDGVLDSLILLSMERGDIERGGQRVLYEDGLSEDMT